MEKRFDTSGYSKDENRSLPIGESKKVIGLMKDELGGKIMTEFVALRAKMCAYRKIDKKMEENRCKGTKKCVVAEGYTFDDFKACLFNGKTYIGSKCCLRIRSTRCTRSISMDSLDQRR